ncbi:hypothetical protein PSE_3078 [Pseudovibrio sp. FO-BEG1]|uniref:DUF6998 domain-containing protein n=1 Tax=Pseudovibrio sp. (strain FO-BEG1) TaxID=911045 RepID=UPI000238D3B6|nr:hypothetical protein [Pseudovibrio sp. FO-BEG1]AEV37586.1 hypothetical protein PSE_3078 [Pseudovibrio sp. FO-BEG1]
MQIIQSLGEALAWFEKELSWGVAPAELNHLTGRIGELYAAMITRGQMALETNQHGYDVISAENERISVKTITSSNHVSFNPNTIDLVDRVMILRVNVDDDQGVSVETILDCSPDQLQDQANESNGKIRFTIGRKTEKRSTEDLKIIDTERFDDYVLSRFENQSIQVERAGEILTPTKPHLREVAKRVGVGLINGSGGAKNTRQLGADVIKALHILESTP